ncbi:hypothetical protein BCR44DRAFT_1512424 [Catenaria anguillulae PL171]|uniref:Cyclic nucleotide-binding domain-containing protein n=1 Tax=Catenaria anguillulae PL171 TaxID=765915 RepID=A0A1Y2HPU3_9FUNG|nr:hypothetical protein BCR44DRAFT_1512424 [Catenaria anguillulae PL171]
MNNRPDPLACNPQAPLPSSPSTLPLSRQPSSPVPTSVKSTPSSLSSASAATSSAARKTKKPKKPKSHSNVKYRSPLAAERKTVSFVDQDDDHLLASSDSSDDDNVSDDHSTQGGRIQQVPTVDPDEHLDDNAHSAARERPTLTTDPTTSKHDDTSSVATRSDFSLVTASNQNLLLNPSDSSPTASTDITPEPKPKANRKRIDMAQSRALARMGGGDDPGGPSGGTVGRNTMSKSQGMHNRANSDKPNPFSSATGRRASSEPFSFAKLWRTLLTFYLIPGEPILTWWNYFMVLVAVVNGVSIPFMAAFRYLYAGSFVSQYILDIIYLLDIFIKFHVSYLDRGFYVVFPKEMALHYMRSWEFSFDLFSNLPFDLIALSWSTSAIPGEIQYFLAIVRLHKLMRTFKLVWWFHKEEKRLNAQAVFQMYKFTIYITLITHWCTCIWYVLACPDQCVSPSWATDPNQNPDFADRLSMYVYSLYWTVMTMTTTGYGDVHATNDRERVWSIICMITGVFLYGYVSGTIASSLSNLDSRRVAYRQKVEAIKQYMQDQNMDKDMQKRVTGWYEYTWERNKGIDVLNVFNDLPSNFRAEVALSVNEDIIEKASIFRGTSLGFRRMLSIAMRINFFTADTYIVHRGEIGREMFFVVQGRVDVLNHDESKAVGSMVEGSSFGEFMLVLGHTCEATAVAVCNCDVYVLAKEDFDQACMSYPEDATKVTNATQEAYQKVQEKANRSKKKSNDDLADLFGDSPTSGPTGGGVHKSSLVEETGQVDPAMDRRGSRLSAGGPAGGAPGGRRPSFGYFVMDQDDQKRIEQLKIEKRRKSTMSVTRFNPQQHEQRVKPVAMDDGKKLVGTLSRGNVGAAASNPFTDNGYSFGGSTASGMERRGSNLGAATPGGMPEINVALPQSNSSMSQAGSTTSGTGGVGVQLGATATMGMPSMIIEEHGHVGSSTRLSGTPGAGRSSALLDPSNAENHVSKSRPTLVVSEEDEESGI